MKIGVIGTHNGWSSELLADSVAQKTGTRLLIDMEDVRLDMDNRNLWYKGQNLQELDGLIVKKIGTRYAPALLNRLEMLRFANQCGLPVFSTPQAIISVLNKLTCTVTLQLAGIPMPATTITENIDEAEAAVEEYGTAICKPLYSSKGRGMIFLSRSDEVRSKLKEYARSFPVIYIQQAIELKENKDLGVVFLNGEYITTYARCKGDSWNTTTAFGGHYEPFDPPQEIIDLAHKAQAAFGLHFTCVDVALTDDGPKIFEVSAFGGFRGILQARGINAADLYTDMVRKELMT